MKIQTGSYIRVWAGAVMMYEGHLEMVEERDSRLAQVMDLWYWPADQGYLKYPVRKTLFSKDVIEVVYEPVRKAGRKQEDPHHQGRDRDRRYGVDLYREAGQLRLLP